MNPDATVLLEECRFPAPGATVDLAVSGGPDSLGLMLLALANGLVVHVHHVDHHARPSSGADAAFVVALCDGLGVAITRHDVEVAPGPNFEARARAARRAVLPGAVMTGHTMDDLVETVLLNMLRGAGIDGLSPMLDDPTKPLVGLRRQRLHEFVVASGWTACHDESNDDAAFARNRVRHELLPLLDDIARRDVVVVLARQARVTRDERAWLDELGREDASLALDDADCRALRDWPVARLRRWLRATLASGDDGDGRHPPSSHELERALGVVRGEVVATELSGGRRLARRDQHLTLTERSPLR